jgi:hypothetical protein
MRTSLSGPVILYGNDNPQQISETDSGPNIDYQANAVLDSRYVSQVTAAGEGAQAGILCWSNPVEMELLSYVPAAANAANIAAAQSPTVGGFFTLATSSTNAVCANIPLVPQGTAIQPTATTIPVLALDFGFAQVTTTTAAGTANILTITGPSPTGYTSTATYGSRFFYPGQRILVGGAGNAAGTVPLSTIVLATDRYAAPGYAVQAAGTVLIANNALFAGTNLPVGTSDQEYGVAVKPVVKAGAARVYDPAQMGTRQVIVTASGASTGTVTIRGYDIYEQPMSETQTIVGSGVTVPKKAFGYVSSVQLNVGSTLTGTLSVGTNSTIGLPIRVDEFEYAGIFVSGAQIFSATGLTFADQTPTATSTTGDVRGTYTMQTAPNGTTNRVVLFYQKPIATAKVSSNIDFRGFTGVTNA